MIATRPIESKEEQVDSSRSESLVGLPPALCLFLTFATISLSFGQPILESLVHPLWHIVVSLAGVQLVRLFDRGSPITQLEGLTRGYFAFMTITTLCGVLLGLIGLPVVMGLIPAIALTIIGRRGKVGQMVVSHDRVESTWMWLFVAGISSALLVAPYHFDGLIVALMLAPSCELLRLTLLHIGPWRIAAVGMAVSVVVLCRMLLAIVEDQPLRARLIDQDVMWDEAVTKGVANLGFDTSPALLGESLRYHIGSHVWGAISDMVTFSSGLSSSGLSGTLMYGIMLALAFMILARQLGGRYLLVSLAGLLGVATALPSPISMLPTHHLRAHQTFALFVLVMSCVVVCSRPSQFA